MQQTQIKKEFKGPIVLVILDGWGEREKAEGNAIKLSKTPVLKGLLQTYPHSLLSAYGKEVGLPAGQRGNSEAGHLNLGAGRIVEQDVVLISKAIKDSRFFKNSAFISAVAHAQKNKSVVHLIGMISGTQSPHVEMNHLYALLRLLDQEGIEKVYLHLFTDGRDAPQHESLKYFKELKEHFLGNEKIASLCGRYFGMDRNKIWSRTEQVYNMLTIGTGMQSESTEDAVLSAYNRGETDEFISPTVIVERCDLSQKKCLPVATIKDNDAIIFFNLRSDRARQLTKCFVQDDFTRKNPGSFTRKKILKNLKFVAMTDFGPDLDHILTAFPSRDVDMTLPMALKDYQQVYLAESEKYAHVTFFFNGGYDRPVGGEKRIVIPSPNIKYYKEAPAMSSVKVTDELVKQLKAGAQFICVNLCNADMIGHTGDLKATVKGIETIDECLGRIVGVALKQNGMVIITADHGNAEEMVNLRTGEVNTEHSAFPVPFILVSKDYQKSKVRNGILADVAPTILHLFNLKKPKEMKGKSLIVS